MNNTKVRKELLEAELFTIPENVANLQLPDPDLLEYYKDTKERIFYIEDVIDDNTFKIVKNIIKINVQDAAIPVEKRTPIVLMINSPGGDVQTMWSLINTMKISKTPIYTLVYGIAMSAAAHILAAGHKRFALPGVTVLVHSGSCQYSGDVEKVESAKKYYDSLSALANKELINMTNILAKDLKKKGSNDWYMTADDALKAGLIDTIVTDFCEVFMNGNA